MTDFDPNWVHGHITRDGRKARVICTDVKNSHYPVVACIAEHDAADESIAQFTMTGFLTHNMESRADLLNAPAPKKKVWVNVYERDTPFSNSYSDRLKADLAAQRDTRHRIACIEVEEGQGLEGVK